MSEQLLLARAAADVDRVTTAIADRRARLANLEEKLAGLRAAGPDDLSARSSLAEGQHLRQELQAELVQLGQAETQARLEQARFVAERDRLVKVRAALQSELDQWSVFLPRATVILAEVNALAADVRQSGLRVDSAVSPDLWPGTLQQLVSVLGSTRGRLERARTELARFE